jgi:hypothetical protein
VTRVLQAVPEPPHEDAAVEKAFVGALLVNAALIPEGRRIVVAPGNLYRWSLGRVYQSILDVADAGQTPDLLTVTRNLREAGDLERVGGEAGVSVLTDGVPKSEHALGYGRMIADAARLRSALAQAQGIVGALMDRDGETNVHELIDGLRSTLRDPAIRSVDLYGPDVIPAPPDFTVANLIRRSGLHLVWAEPGGGKTWALLRWAHELMLSPRPSRLTGHPDLWINRGWSRVLWIATEEDAGTLRYKADMVLRGLDGRLDGQIRHLFAPGPGRRITLDDLPAIIETDGPFDAVILDSLTGLRPRMVGSERVRWDVDNDAANEMCLRLRALAMEHNLAIFIVHHTSRKGSEGSYRGPTDWWASADVMFGLVPDGGRTKVVVEKNRDGRRIAPFYLTPTWAGDTYTLDYDGGACPVKLTPTANKVLAFYQGRGRASQAEAVAAGLAARGTVQDAIRALVSVGLLYDTGNKVNGSPIYAATDEVPEGAGKVPCHAV